MPASMMSAPTGGRPKVIGSSMAMVASDPMPGSTPISVPTSAPIRQRNTFMGVTATCMPIQRFEIRSYMVVSRRLPEPGPKLERQVQAIRKQDGAEGGHDNRNDQRLAPLH